MTYRRPENSFAAAWTFARRACGAEALASALGCSASRLRQLANPMRGDSAVLDLAAAADAACAAAGGGTPILDIYTARLRAAGVRTTHRPHPSPALRAALTLARRLVDTLESALAPAAVPAPALAGRG